jgi:hypothetical protein
MIVHALLLSLMLVQDPDVPALIRQLGSSDFDAREKADQELRRIGEKALPALEKAAGDEDPEIAARAKRLIDDIKKTRRSGRAPGGARSSYSMKMVTPEVDLSVGPDGVVLKEKSTGKTYEAESIEEFKKKHPEQAEKHLKHFSFDVTPGEFGDLRKRMRERFKDLPLPPDVPEFDRFFADPPEFQEFFRRRFGERFGQLPPMPSEFDEFFRRPREEPPAGRPNARLGAQTGPVSETLRQQLGLKENEGVLVERVEPESLAARAGLQAHDVIVSIDQAPVGNRWELRQAIAERAASGAPFEVVVVRKAQRQTLQMKFDAPAAEQPPAQKKAPKKEDF